MDRFIAKDAKLDKYDLTKLNLRDSYFNGCSLVGAKFGDCTNATFYNCDLQGSDVSKAVLYKTIFPKSNISNMQFPTATSVGQIAASIIDKFGISAFFPLHSHEVIAEIAKQKGTLTTDLKTKTAALDISSYILNHRELSWDGFATYLVTKWGKAGTTQLVEALFDDRSIMLEKALTSLERF